MSYKKTVERKAFIPKYPPSPEQESIFNEIRFGDGNLRIDAVAGSGKSTTLKWIASMIQSHNAGMMAFSSDIAAELLKETPDHVTVKTCHAMGYGPLIKAFGSRVKDKGPSKTRMILDECGFKPEKVGDKMFQTRNEMENLVSKIKVNLTDWRNYDEVIKIVDQYGIDVEDVHLSKIDVIMEKSKAEVKQIEFDDMMWLPIMYDMDLWRYDFLMVDEAQDLNNLMMEYASRISKGRVIIVGDEMQAIFRFAGANCDSFKILGERFECESMPLSTCYRCGSKIVERAQKINPVITAHESTGEGEVRDITDEYDYDLPEGSLVISRKNNTLVRPCFEMIKRGRKAVIKGRDIGVGLAKIIDNFNQSDIPSFLDKLDAWRDEKISNLSKRKNPSQSQIDYIEDQVGVLEVIAEGCRDTSDMKNKINMIFSKSNGEVTFSSIHKSKGLEADVVAILDYGNVRLNHAKMDHEDRMQEKNLEYVALTRAKKRLDLVYYEK